MCGLYQAHSLSFETPALYLNVNINLYLKCMVKCNRKKSNEIKDKPVLMENKKRLYNTNVSQYITIMLSTCCLLCCIWTEIILHLQHDHIRDKP